MTGAAYSKPVSALQRSISQFCRSFCRPVSQSPAGAPYIAACHIGWLASFAGERSIRKGRQELRHDRRKRKARCSGAQDFSLWPRVRNAAFAPGANRHRGRPGHPRYFRVFADPRILDDSAGLAGSFLRVRIGAATAPPFHRLVGTAPLWKTLAMKPHGLTQKCGQPIGAGVKRRERRGLQSRPPAPAGWFDPKEPCALAPEVGRQHER